LKRLSRLLQSLSSSKAGRISGRVAQSTADTLCVPLHATPRYETVNARTFCPRFPELSDELVRRLSAFDYAGYWTGMGFLERARMVYHPPPEPEALKTVLTAFLEQVFACTLEHRNARYYLEKHPWFILCFDEILELIPRAGLVVIHRDPRDVVASFTRQTWMPSDPVKSALMVRDILKRWWQIRETLPETRYLEVTLDSLVERPEPVLRDICRFWGIPWHDALLEMDLTKSHTGRWKSAFTAKEEKAVCDILAEPLAALGYE